MPTKLLPTGKNYVAHRDGRLVIVGNCISALGDFVTGSVWQRDPEAWGGMRLLGTRDFHGTDAPARARKWIGEHTPARPRLKPGRMPLYVAHALHWWKPGR